MSDGIVLKIRALERDRGVAFYIFKAVDKVWQAGLHKLGDEGWLDFLYKKGGVANQSIMIWYMSC